MKLLHILPLVTVVHATIQGISISRYQSVFNFTEAHSMGLRYAYIKATEGTTYTDPKYRTHYATANGAGFLCGGTHIAHPSASSGSAQADFFLSNGGAWQADAVMLPGLLDLNGDCAGMGAEAMVKWIQEFGDTYKAATGRWPVLKTENTWWVECTGNTKAFVDQTGLMLVRWGASPGSVPGGWRSWLFWQYAGNGAWGGNSAVFNGDADALRKLAEG
jgi:GH25 family lysozyme M1 (1,4-beta-N-acetylmuramidase)